MKTIERTDDLRAWRNSLKGTVGFVPTMGALHEGHLELITQAAAASDHVVVSIFINPTQFNNPEDFMLYPKSVDKDLDKMKNLRVDVVFLPSADEMYQDAYRFRISESQFSLKLCGAYRPGHFDGVLTVVLKLLNLVQPTRAYFGEKDFQQLQLIKDMVSAFYLPVEIVPVPTVREADGLAMSSRNLRLTPEQRELAPALAFTLKSSATPDQARAHLTELGFKVDYVEDHFGRRFAAAHLGNVRLIDNVIL